MMYWCVAVGAGSQAAERCQGQTGELGSEHCHAASGQGCRRSGDQNVHHAGLRRASRGGPRGHAPAAASRSAHLAAPQQGCCDPACAALELSSCDVGMLLGMECRRHVLGEEEEFLGWCLSRSSSPGLAHKFLYRAKDSTSSSSFLFTSSLGVQVLMS